MQILSAHFPPTEAAGGIDKSLRCARWRERGGRSVSTGEKRPLRGPRAARHGGLSFSLVSMRSGTLRATLGAHVCRSIAHELEIYGTRARRWHGCTAEAAPRRAALRRAAPLFCIVVAHLLDCATTRLYTCRKRDREGMAISSVRGEARRRGNDVYQLHPAHSNCRAQYVLVAPRISLCLACLFLEPHCACWCEMDFFTESRADDWRVMWASHIVHGTFLLGLSSLIFWRKGDLHLHEEILRKENWKWNLDLIYSNNKIDFTLFLFRYFYFYI